MSSTLYNRGTTTQTGMRRRAEAVDKALADTATIATDASRTVRLLEARLAALEAANTANLTRITALEMTHTTNQTRVAALEARIAALTAPAPAVATVVTSPPVVASPPVVPTVVASAPAVATE